MMEVHLNRNSELNNYYITLINPDLNRGWHVWESLSNDFQGDWDNFEYYFEQLRVGEGGWNTSGEDLEGKCIYRGTDAHEAKQTAIRYTEYL